MVTQVADLAGPATKLLLHTGTSVFPVSATHRATHTVTASTGRNRCFVLLALVVVLPIVARQYIVVLMPCEKFGACSVALLPIP